MKNYQLFRRDRTNKGGGGVMVYIKKSIGINEPTIDLTSLNEIIALKLSLPGNKTIGLIAAYRPPHYQNEESFLETLETNVLKYDSVCDDIIIAGDLNFDCFDHIKSTKLVDFTISHGFTNTVSQGTRTCPQTGNCMLLDVILCLLSSCFISSMTFTYANSDHKLVVSTFKYKTSKNKSQEIKTRTLNEKNLLLIKKKIGEYFKHTNNSHLTNGDVLWDEIKKGISILNTYS